MHIVKKIVGSILSPLSSILPALGAVNLLFSTITAPGEQGVLVLDQCQSALSLRTTRMDGQCFHNTDWQEVFSGETWSGHKRAERGLREGRIRPMRRRGILTPLPPSQGA